MASLQIPWRFPGALGGATGFPRGGGGGIAELYTEGGLIHPRWRLGLRLELPAFL